MKTERRHELQHNELADWIAVNYRKVQPYLKSIAAVVIAAFVLFYAYNYITSRSQEKSLGEWGKLSQAGDIPDTIKRWSDLMTENPANTPLGAAVRMRLGNLCMEVGGGKELYGSGRAASLTHLDRAVACFTELVRDAADPSVRQAAQFRLALAQELLGKLDESTKQYAKLAEGNDLVYKATAKADLDDLKNPKTISFYDTLSATLAKPPVDSRPSILDPRPSDSPFDTPGLPGSVIDDKFKGFDPPLKAPGTDPGKPQPNNK